MTSKRTAIVTGASKGLGYTLADWLASQGYDLVVDARREEPLQQAARAFEQHGDIVHAIAGDIADAAHRQHLLDAAEGLGGLHLLVNNASTLGPLPLSPLVVYSPETLKATFEVNLFAPVALIQLAMPLLKRSNGLVVNISSDAAIGGYEGWGGYGASKAALDLASRTLANELDGAVAVVAVDPGDMRTDMQRDAFPGEDISDRPMPSATIPFWAWLLNQEHAAINGRRYEAQAEVWEVHP